MKDLPSDLDRSGPDGAALIEVAVVLVGLQAAILLTGIVEAAVFAMFVGTTALVSMALNAIAAVVTLVTAAGLGRHARWARRWTLVAESGVLVMALPDAVVGPLLSGAGPSLVSILTRVVLPLVVIGLLRRPRVRATFGVAAA